MEGQQFQASADINVSVFVKISGDNQVETAGAGDLSIGIMHDSAWDTPIPGADRNVAVPAGQSKRVFQADEVCKLLVGTGGLSAGQLVKPDANGAGVTAVATDAYSAICLEGAAAGEFAKVVVNHGVA